MGKTYQRVKDFITGDRIFEADMDKITQGINNLIVPSVCRVYHNAGQTIPNGTETALAFNSERFDTDAMHETNVNNSRITITTSGIYLVTASVAWASSGVGIRTLSLRLNGTIFIAADTRPNNGASAGLTQHVSAPYEFVVGQYVEAVVAQTSGGNLDVVAVGNYSPEFLAIWQCPYVGRLMVRDHEEGGSMSPKMVSPASARPDHVSWVYVARCVRGMTQRDLASATGLSRITVGRVEGRPQRPRRVTQRVLAEELGFPAEELWPTSRQTNAELRKAAKAIYGDRLPRG